MVEPCGERKDSHNNTVREARYFSSVRTTAWYGYMRPAHSLPAFFSHMQMQDPPVHHPSTGLCPTKTAGHSAAEA